MSHAPALQRCALFQGFSETGLLIFSSVARERTLAAGAALFAEGQPGESLFVVVSGELRITQRAEDREEELARVGAGEAVGALALLAPGPRLVSAAAVVDCALLEIAARDFARLQPQKPKACLKLALAIAAEVARRAAESREALRGAARARSGE